MPSALSCQWCTLAFLLPVEIGWANLKDADDVSEEAVVGDLLEPLGAQHEAPVQEGAQEVRQRPHAQPTKPTLLSPRHRALTGLRTR